MKPLHARIPRRRPGFTLVELLVVIAIIGLLAAILIPTVGGMRQRAGTTQTVSNLRQIHSAMLLYAGEHGNSFPVPRAGSSDTDPVWSLNILFPYLNPEIKNPTWSNLAGTIFTSPNAPEIGERDNPDAPIVAGAGNQGFGMNSHLPSFEDTPTFANFGTHRKPSVTRLQDLPRTMLLMDCNAQIIFGGAHFVNQYTTYISTRHKGRTSVLFGDGRVELIPHERFAVSSTSPLVPWTSPEGSEASVFWRGF